jgi:hypothetical protein
MRLVWEALILTHEMASHQERDAYLTERLKPLTPLMLFGRSASLAPPTKPRFCVYDAWKDSEHE